MGGRLATLYVDLMTGIGLAGRIAQGLEVAFGDRRAKGVLNAPERAVGLAQLYAAAVEPESAEAFVITSEAGEVEDGESIGCDEIGNGLIFFFSALRYWSS